MNWVNPCKDNHDDSNVNIVLSISVINISILCASDIIFYLIITPDSDIFILPELYKFSRSSFWLFDYESVSGNREKMLLRSLIYKK